MDRHAYLIVAHDNFYVLEQLIRLLDDPRNDIFLHVDAKAHGFDPSLVNSLCRRSRVVLLPRMKVYWGDYSQVRAVLRMLSVALIGNYAYYHVLSGSDLPLKSPDRIHQFFADHSGDEFVAFNKEPVFTHDWLAYFHPLNRLAKSPHALLSASHARFTRASLGVQRRLQVDRTRHWGVEIKYGSDWYSITSDLARHLVDNEERLRGWFRWSFNPVEYYVQTVVWNSRFRSRVHDLVDPYTSTMRLIDFPRGAGSSPYTWRESDYDELVASERLFARKFNPGVDREIIDLLVQHVRASS